MYYEISIFMNYYIVVELGRWGQRFVAALSLCGSTFIVWQWSYVNTTSLFCWWYFYIKQINNAHNNIIWLMSFLEQHLCFLHVNDFNVCFTKVCKVANNIHVTDLKKCPCGSFHLVWGSITILKAFFFFCLSNHIIDPYNSYHSTFPAPLPPPLQTNPSFLYSIW